MSVGYREWTSPKTGKASGHWYIDVKVETANGKIVRVRDNSPINTKRGAEEHERQVRQQIVDGTYGKTATETPTVSEFSKRFMEYSTTNNGRSTFAAKEGILKNHLLPHFGKMKLDDLTPAEIERYKAFKTKEKLKAKTVNNHLAVLGKLLNLANEWGVLDKTFRLKPIKLGHRQFQFLTFEETPLFLAKVPAEWKALITCALNTGLRIGELLALKWEDVDLRAGQIVVRRTLWQGHEGPPKSGKFRNVPMPDSLKALLHDHRHLRGDYVFCLADGKRMTHSMVKDLVPKFCKAAGLAKRLTMHDLRHTYASHLVMKGVSIKAVQELLGHATIDMTMRYAHLTPDSKKEAVKVLDQPHTPEGHNRVTKSA